VHDWVPIEEIGLMVTYRCECGRTRTRIAGDARHDPRREGSLKPSAPRAERGHPRVAVRRDLLGVDLLEVVSGGGPSDGVV
jgi:hypothetical protein